MQSQRPLHRVQAVYLQAQPFPESLFDALLFISKAVLYPGITVVALFFPLFIVGKWG